MPIRNLTKEIISAAIMGFEAQKKRIDSEIADLRAMLPSSRTESTATADTSTPKRKKFSAAARRRMKEAQRQRWAKIRGESAAPAAQPTPPKQKRIISAAGRRAMSEATKRRWALKRAETGKMQPSVAKRPAAKKSAAKILGKKTAKAA